MRTPFVHFDYFNRKFPEGAFVYDLVRQKHRDFSNDELLRGRINPILDTFDGTTRMLCHMMLIYERFGENTYVVGPKVQDLFRRTELTRVTTDMVKMPHTGIYVALPDCPWRIWGGDRTQWHQVTGLYISSTLSYSRQGLPPEKGIHFCIWGAPNERSVAPSDDAVLWYSINLEDWARAGEDLEEYFRGHTVMTADREHVEGWKGRDPIDPRSPPLLPSDPEHLHEQRETLTSVLRLVLNLCLYLGSVEPDLRVMDPADEGDDLRRQIAKKKAGGKRKKLERRLANLRKTRIVHVGPMFEELEPSPGSPGTPHQGGTHATPFEHAVKPHWQRYWVGTNEQRRAQWTLKGMYVRGTGMPDRTITKILEPE